MRWLRDPGDGARIDQGLVIAFPAPHSFTGEDVVELQVHGSPAVCAVLLEVLARSDGCRIAEPGEFTKRALLNGRVDLAQVEGLGDLLMAETRAQHRQALDVMAGSLSSDVALWRDLLIQGLAHLEASIDFADEDLPGDVTSAARPYIADALRHMRAALAGSAMAERIRDGFDIALVGRPNAGKSTLLNRLARREAALTSEVAGTTRDVIEVRMDLEGIPVTVLDMAGLREAAETVEALGVERARARAEAADIRVFLVADREEVPHFGVGYRVGDLVKLDKLDLRPADVTDEDGVSGLSGRGVDVLLRELAGTLNARAAKATMIAHTRQRVALSGAAEALEAALGNLTWPEIAAQDIHIALRKLDFLMGKLDVEVVLGAIFQRFCVGK